MSVYGLFPKQDYSRFIQVAVVIDFLNHVIIYFHIRVLAYPQISVKFVDALGQKVQFLRNINVRISNVLGLLKSSASFFTTNLVTMSTTIIAGEYFFHRNKYNRTCSRWENCGKTSSNQEQSDIAFSKFDLYSQRTCMITFSRQTEPNF